MGITVVQYYGKQISRCGYCKGNNGSVGYGMHAYQMTPQDYQDLIDRGWRRSGNYCYKQNNQTTCCPCYTIRCNALEFQLSKSHKKLLKRMNKFLRDGKKEKIETDNLTEKESEDNVNVREEVKAPDVVLKDINLEAAQKAINTRQQAVFSKKKQRDNIVSEKPESSQAKKEHETLQKQPEATNDSKQACKKAKQKRLEQKLAKQQAKGLVPTNATKPLKNNEKFLKDYINDTTPEDKHKLKIVLVPSSKNFYTETAFNLYCKYQLTVHNDSPERLTPQRLQRFCYCSPLKLVLVHVKNKAFAETLQESYALYRKYQTLIHNDPPSHVRDYLHFLQKSPLKLTKTEDGPVMGYGSFHQQYWLDDKLIAVAVLDILPHCVSSVYFFYDPDYSFLSLGTYSSLREIELVQQLAATKPSLTNYYMGFYIHSCPKMRYKGKLVPSYLLCPETYTWHLITDELRLNLDSQKYLRFNNNPSAKDVNEFSDEDINAVLLLNDGNSCSTYADSVQFAGEDDRAIIIEYGKLVGKTLTQRMLYVKM